MYSITRKQTLRQYQCCILLSQKAWSQCSFLFYQGNVSHLTKNKNVLTPHSIFFSYTSEIVENFKTFLLFLKLGQDSQSGFFLFVEFLRMAFITILYPTIFRHCVLHGILSLPEGRSSSSSRAEDLVLQLCFLYREDSFSLFLG